MLVRLGVGASLWTAAVPSFSVTGRLARIPLTRRLRDRISEDFRI